jgi:glutamate-1-semialdehyde 2,1-aminomutase
MAAGLATLRILEREDVWTRFESLGQHLEELMAPVLAKAALPLSMVRLGSVFWLSLQDGEPPRTAECIDPRAAERYRPLFHLVKDRGYSIAPSAYEVGFLSLAHETKHIEGLVGALADALQDGSA